MPTVNAVSFREYSGIEAICRAAKDAGFDGLELSRPHFYESLCTIETVKRFKDFAAEQQLRCYGFDCWVDVEPFTDFDQTVLEFDRAADWAAALDLGMIISHDPWDYVNGNRSPSECLTRCLELFQQVVDICAAKDLSLVFEPHPDTLSMRNSWAIDFIDALAENRRPGSVGLLYDCCHYGVGQPDEYVDSIKTLGHRIRHIHYSDGDCETYALHLAPGDGRLDLEGVVSALEAIDYRGTITSDMFNNPMLEDCGRRSAPCVREVEQRLGIGTSATN